MDPTNPVSAEVRPAQSLAGEQVRGQVPNAVSASPAATSLPPPAPAANWYQDPRGEARLRYWDGGGWTEHTTE